ncbi:MAG: CHAT domain-containing protein [Stigonema ocellatum SAG 48.90 = DSM 106950]|nr:CHAT domain-containing protein [Stigonema ocellatum SAG 48.90 = DSM 106950]
MRGKGNRRHIRPKIRYQAISLLIVALVTFLLCLIGSPLLAKVPLQPSMENPSVWTQYFMQQGRELYDEGQFAEAIKVLQQAMKEYSLQGDELKQAMTLSNLSLVYQQLGRLAQAQRAIADCLLLLKKSSDIQNCNRRWTQMNADNYPRSSAYRSSERRKPPLRQISICGSKFSLGKSLSAQQDTQGAIAYYQQAAKVSPSPMTKVQAQIKQLSLLVSTGQQSAALTLLPEIQTQLASLPPSETSIYGRIHLAQILMKLGNQQSAVELAKAVQQARSLEDRRSEVYALGSLGSVYEQTGQWSDAQDLTQKALVLAQAINAPELTYRWHWQLGRLLKKQGHIKGAIAAYDAAVSELQPIRSDLVAINREVQFSFKESVEPVYRESVELLLQSQETSPTQDYLEKARLRIEALQLAELDDFFRESCLSGKFVKNDKIVEKNNPTAAIIYPIILPHQLQVIVKIPKLPLRNYWVDKPQKEVENILAQLQEYILEPDREDEVQSLSHQVYGWLVQPIASKLEKSGVNTLVFVLDGALRSVPMATLYDGQQYLVEKYAVALSLGLQLLEPKPLTQVKLKVLAAGLVQPPGDYQKKFPPLPEIKSELKSISQAHISTTVLLDQDFNSKNLEIQVNAVPFNVLHLATHGQFSSSAENTFILAADGPINVTQFDSLLRQRDETRREALEILVLSACQTAAGDNRATLGLAGVSVRAGARSTLASLWQISDKSTAILIGEFYRELASAKVTKAEALRRAQVTLLKKYPNYSRPGYWAPYVLVGNWL